MLFTRKPHFVITGDGNITVAWRGRGYSIGTTHPNYAAIRQVFDEQKRFKRLDALLLPGKTVERELDGVTINEFGEVFWNGEQMHGTLADRISQFMRKGEDYKPLARFMANLMANPSARSVTELYGFLEHGGFPITEDGCFIAYKGVTSDFTDMHTGRFDNHPGVTNEMPRNKVNDDYRQACSVGFHVGTLNYASGFAGSSGKVVLVKVSPADAVSVPYDHNAEKLRVCKYEVIEESERLIEEPVYREPWLATPTDDDEEDDFEDPFCDLCGEEYCEGECDNECGACGYSEDDCECEGPVDDCQCEPPIDPRTGRARGEGGRFLPRK